MMYYYIKVFKQLLINSWAYLFVYRAAFVVKGLTDILWAIVFIAIIEIIYGHTELIGQWSKGETIFLFGFILMFLTLHDVLFRHGFNHLGRLIILGEFDFIITKPLNHQFLLMFKRINFNRLADIVIAGAVLWYGSHLLNIVWSFRLFLILLTAQVLSVALFYSLLLFFAAMLFWSPGADNIMWLARSLVNDIGRWPVEIFGKTARMVFFTILPIAVMTNLPVMIILQKINLSWLLYMLLITLAVFIFSTKVYNWSVRHYQSASS